MPPWAKRVLLSSSRALVTSGDGVLAAEFERSDQPGDAAADDDDVLHAERSRGSCHLATLA